MAFRNLPEMPCGPILELHGQRKRFHVPYGLKRLIEDMTREVLRYQPENIYEFLAGFMDLRLQKKLTDQAKQSQRKSWQQHRWSWQGGSILEPEDLKEFLAQLPAPAEEATHHATVIQAAFRGYQARKKVKNIRQSQEVKRKTVLGSKFEEEEEEEETEEEEEFRQGKNMKKRKTEVIDLSPETVTDEELKSVVTIQAAFRGMHARKEVKKLRASLTEQRNSVVQADEKAAELSKNDEDKPVESENAKPNEETEVKLAESKVEEADGMQNATETGEPPSEGNAAGDGPSAEEEGLIEVEGQVEAKDGEEQNAEEVIPG